MPATPGICTAAKLAWLKSMEHDDIWIALYGADAEINPNTSTYTPKGEVSGVGYRPGGMRMDGINFGTTGSTAWIDWTVDPRWENATIKAHAAMIYNRTRDNLAIAVLKFAGEVASTNGPWWMELPAPGATATIRWA